VGGGTHDGYQRGYPKYRQRNRAGWGTLAVENDEGDAFAFPTPFGLCLVGLSRWSRDYHYIDIRWRVLIGEMSHSFDPRSALKANHGCPEVPYGIASLDEKDILTITDTLRVFELWGAEEIGEIVRLRFGGALAVPFVLPGVTPASVDQCMAWLSKHGFKKLLSIQESSA
jgi:hypothetical protein